MPFAFAHVCQLLQDIEKTRVNGRATLGNPQIATSSANEISGRCHRILEKWFETHGKQINNPELTDGTALLSTLLPERRTDRVFALREARLLRLLPRALHLSAARTRALNAFLKPGNGDLASFLETVLKEFDSEPRPSCNGADWGEVTVEEVDSVFGELASRIAFSAPEVRAEKEEVMGKPADGILRPLVLRLKSWEVKWITRMLLKDLAPAILDDKVVLSQFHFLLPGLLRFQDQFATSMAMLNGPLRKYPARPDEESQVIFKAEAAGLVYPRLGICVGRPPFFKARSLEHCLQMTKEKRWTMERKYDGEYAQIHIDLSNTDNPIRIFSKSGKDSTQDRAGVHRAVLDALRVGKSDCTFTKHCIVLGELVVFCDKNQKILGFEHIRKHVTRTGRRIEASFDSPIKKTEHLMIVFFDVLLVDDLVTMSMPHSIRREHLKRIINKIPGHAITSDWKIHDFSQDGSAKILAYQLLDAVAKRTEGLVLKPADSCYYSFASSEDKDYFGYFIKVKMDYFSNMGTTRDVLDLAVVGAGYDVRTALKLGMPRLKFTTFYIGCLINREQVRFGHQPIFEVVDVIEAGPCISTVDLLALNNHALFYGTCIEDGAGAPTLMDSSHARISTYFVDPLVVEVLGSGYSKATNKTYFTLRHARILKLHLDRSWRDCLDMAELQSVAAKALNTPSQGESQEMMRLMNQMKAKYVAKNGLFSDSVSSSLRTTPWRSISTVETLPLEKTTKDTAPLRVYASFPLQPISPNRQLSTRSQSTEHTGNNSTRSKSEVSPKPKGPLHLPETLENTKGLEVRVPTPPSSKIQPPPNLFKKRKQDLVSNKRLASPPQKKRLISIESETTALISTLLPGQQSNAINKSRRPLCNAVVISMSFHSQSVSHHSALRDRIDSLGAVWADGPADWTRESQPLKYPIEVIPESQSYPGLVKVVLVDGRADGDIWWSGVQKALVGCREKILIVDTALLDHLKERIDSNDDLKEMGKKLERYWLGVYDGRGSGGVGVKIHANDVWRALWTTG
jgi:DNA ligase 4